MPPIDGRPAVDPRSVALVRRHVRMARDQNPLASNYQIIQMVADDKRKEFMIQVITGRCLESLLTRLCRRRRNG